MTAKEILEWLSIKQGTASKSEIRRVWYALPDEGLTEWEVDQRFGEIGCEVPETEPGLMKGSNRWYV